MDGSSLLSDLEEIRAFYAREKECCRNSGWGSFAEAKGNAQWSNNFCNAVVELLGPDRELTPEKKAKIESLIGTLSWEEDYGEPEGAKSRVRAVLAREK